MSEKLGLTHKYIPSSNTSNHNTLLLLHGTGGNEDSLIPISEIILPGAVVLSPRGNILENGMPRFFRRIAEGVFDMQDLKERTNELARFIEGSAKIYDFETDNLIAVGYSNGANIALSVILTFPGLFSKAVLFHPMIPFVPTTTPDLSNTSILITAGTNDPIVDSDETNDLYTLLQSYGANLEIYWHEMGHNLTRDELSRTVEFLK